MPRIRWVNCFFFLVVSSLVFGQALPPNILSAPARLELDKSTIEVKHGATVTYTVTLKNAQNQPVAAAQDLQISVDVPGTGKAVTIPQGQSSATFELPAMTDGISRVTAHAGNLGDAHSLLLVTPSLTSATRKISEITVTPQSRPTPAPGMSARTAEADRRPAKAVSNAARSALAGNESAAKPLDVPIVAPVSPAPPPPAVQPRKIQIYVEPEPVLGNAATHQWTASVTVAALGEHDDLVPVADDVPVHFTTSIGQLTASDIMIHRGEISNFNSPLSLTSSRSGQEHLTAASSLGPAQADVVYGDPVPTRLALVMGPPTFSSNGSAVAPVWVDLQDEAHNLTSYPDRDTQSTLTSTIGQFDNGGALTIPRNHSASGQINLVSRASGSASIHAQSTGELLPDDEQLRLPGFPWYLVLLAAAGGLLGATIASWGDLISPRWWSQVWRNLVLGAVLGMLFYLFAFFGAIALPKDSPVNLQNIPTLSGIGALLLGFLGGIYGRKLWKVGEEDPKPA